ncbi:MAG TPA: hypothetical protein PKC39_10775 [Ferruginibacter sp.]|nr:hypothetical protein [Ferruginibacter sp.]HMP21432.1 hypothetical protein [Ferruginibacter sp.]
MCHTTIKLNGQQLAAIQAVYAQNNLVTAKEAIDSYTIVHPQDIAGLLLKARIYNAIATNAPLAELHADSRTESFKSILQAAAINSNGVKAQLEQDNFELLTTIYNGYTSDGIAVFNAAAEKGQQQEYENALLYFKKAAQVNNFLTAQGWGGTSPDADNLYYSAISAMYAEHISEAYRFCKIIADYKLVFTIPDKDFEPAYQWLVFYLRQKKQAALLDAYTKLSDSLFPRAAYFILNYIDWQREQQDYTNLFTAYTKLLHRFPAQPQYRLYYYHDIFQYVYSNAGTGALADTLAVGLPALVLQYPNDAGARLLLARYYMQQAASLQSIPGKKQAQKNYMQQAVTQLKYIVDRLPRAAKKQVDESATLLVYTLKLLNRKDEAAFYSKRLL